MSLTEKVISILNTIQLPLNASIILDIDDTIISSKTGYVNLDILNIYNIAIERNITIFIITARKDNVYVIDYTYKQLHNIGIYATIYFMSIYENDIAKYKENARKYIYNCGYNTIISIGDMSWDVGMYGGYGIILK